MLFGMLAHADAPRTELAMGIDLDDLVGALAHHVEAASVRGDGQFDRRGVGGDFGGDVGRIGGLGEGYEAENG